MFELLGVPPQALFGQVLLGLINGSFYAILSLGLAVIFGLLNIINFSHGAQYMMGAFVAWMCLTYLGINYWAALLLAPLIVGATGIAIERLAAQAHRPCRPSLRVAFDLRPGADHPGAVPQFQYGSSGLPYADPGRSCTGGVRISASCSCPGIAAWVDHRLARGLPVSTWFLIEKTKLGAYLRAATENPTLTQAFGINVPLMVTLTYGFGVALAGFAGVLAAPIYSVNPNMGADLIIVVFAVVVIGGMGSIHRRHRHRLLAGAGRGPDQGVLPGGRRRR